jgi:hypothetical protein
MATVTLKALISEHFKPPPLLRPAYETFMSLCGEALDEVRIPLPDPAAAAKAVGDALSPMDPSKVLLEVARAVSDAEKTLNGQNLAVLQGKVNVQLLVKIGDAAGGQANFDLAIGPTPQG